MKDITKVYDIFGTTLVLCAITIDYPQVNIFSKISLKTPSMKNLVQNLNFKINLIYFIKLDLQLMCMKVSCFNKVDNMYQ